MKGIMKPSNPSHPRSIAAGLGGALAIVFFWASSLHPTVEEAAAVTTITSYLCSLLPGDTNVG